MTDDRGRDLISANSLRKQSRTRAIKQHAKEMLERGERVTLATTRQFLISLDRDYSLKADQIGFALRHMRTAGTVERYTNGRRVKVGLKIYRSIRAAAEAKGVSPNTVRNRIASKNVLWLGWKYVD